MIQHLAICSQCGNQSEIDKNTNAFQTVLKVYGLKDHSFNDSFGNNWLSGPKRATTTSPDQVDWINECFCDRDCFIEYLKQKMLDGGMIQMSQEEFKQMEEEQPKEIKELRRVAKALSDLENMAVSPILGGHSAKPK